MNFVVKDEDGYFVMGCKMIFIEEDEFFEALGLSCKDSLHFIKAMNNEDVPNEIIVNDVEMVKEEE